MVSLQQGHGEWPGDGVHMRHVVGRCLPLLLGSKFLKGGLKTDQERALQGAALAGAHEMIRTACSGLRSPADGSVAARGSGFRV